MSKREIRVRAARYLVKIAPERYYLSYDEFGSLRVWERTGGILDWLVDSID